MNLDEATEKVAAFHRAFGHPWAEYPNALPADRRRVRARWMAEEVAEWLDADNIIDQADAMIDLIYFALGSFVEMGIQPQRLFDIVHEANMAKLGAEGRPLYGADGKVRKPDNWVGPDVPLRAEINRQQAESETLHAEWPKDYSGR